MSKQEEAPAQAMPGISRLNQIGYGQIEIDNTEIDIIQIWMFDGESNIVQVRRENIDNFIKMLQTVAKEYTEKSGYWNKTKTSKK